MGPSRIGCPRRAAPRRGPPFWLYALISRATHPDFFGPAVGARPIERVIVLGMRGVAHVIRIDQIAACERAYIGASGRDDRIGIAVADDSAHRHGRNIELVADLVAEDRLIEPALDQRATSGRDPENIVAGSMEH